MRQLSIHPVIYLDDLILIEKTVKEILISKNKLIFSLSVSGFCYISKNVGSRQDIYHEITLKILEIFVNFNKNSKTWFFTFLNIYVSLMDLDKILISQLSPWKPGILQTRMDQRGDTMQMNFDNFQMQKWVCLKGSQSRWGVICLIFMSLSRFIFIRLTKTVSFLHFFADVCKTSKAVIAISEDHLKVLVLLFQKMILLWLRV